MTETTRIRRSMPAVMEQLSDARQVRVIVSTEEVGRDNIVMMTSGIDLTHYRANPVVLWNHDDGCPVARTATIDTDGSNLVALVQFPPEGELADADRVYNLIRNGIVNTVSIGADPIDADFNSPNDRDSGVIISRAEMLEFSFVTIPAVRGATITARSANSPQVQKGTPMKTVLTRSLVKRGMYEVAQLAYLLGELGWLKDAAEWEAETEGDQSKLPAMLGAALKSLGDAMIAMTAEEVAELIAEPVEAPAPEPADVDYIEAGKTAEIKRTRAMFCRAARAIGRRSPGQKDAPAANAERARRRLELIRPKDAASA